MSRFKHYNKKSGTTTTVPASLDLAFISDTREILTHGETYGGYIGNNNVINLGGSSLTPVKLDISVNGSTVVNHDTFGNASKVNLLNGDVITLSTTVVDQIPRVTIGHNSILTQDTDFTRSSGQVIKKISVTKQGHISAIEFEDITLPDIPTHAALTMTSAGGGDNSGTTFDGSAARTISYNSIGAAPLDSAALTGTPTTPNPAANAADGQIANVKYVKDSITDHFANSGAMKWMGTTNLTYFNNTITKQSTINTGMAWKITEAGTYAGQLCEIGDVIIAITDQPGTTASNYLIIQKNVDLATRTFTDGTITSQTPGIVNVGTNINLVNGNISVNTANGSTLGLVKEGTGTSISSGTISVTSAPKLQNTTVIGDVNSPVYFTNKGVPAAITTTSVAHGGTGLDTLTSGKVLIGNGTGAVTFKDPKVTIGGVDVELGGSLSLDQIGLNSAMHFLGISSTAITNNGTEKPTINSTQYNSINSGDVVIYGTLEYVWNGSKWCLLGQDGSYKVTQTAVTGAANNYTSGNDQKVETLIKSLTQTANGNISYNTGDTWDGYTYVGTGTGNLERRIVCVNNNKFFSADGITMNYANKSITATTFNGNLSGDVTGNADTATALKAARTLWGQSFNGTANVSGNMTDVGSITSTGNIDASATGTTSRHIQVSNSNGAVDIRTSINRGLYDATNGKWIIATDGTNTWMSEGKVGIGITSPTEKLDVDGNVKATKFIGALQGNAATATKLATARTLWGQSFDGSANVSGALTDVTSITASTGIATGYTDVAADLDGVNRPWYGLTFNGNTGKLQHTMLSDYYGMCFRSNNTHGGFYFQDAKVGIGTNAPLAKLHIVDTTDTSLSNHGLMVLGNVNTTNLCFDQNEIMARNNGAASKLYINAEGGDVVLCETGGGKVGIGTSTPTQKLEVNGNILATGSAYANSDRRLKSNIQPLEYRGPLKPVTFIKNGKEGIGFIAQDVKELYPELVSGEETENTYLSLDYASLTAVLAAQVNEQEARISKLEKQMELLISKMK